MRTLNVHYTTTGYTYAAVYIIYLYIIYTRFEEMLQHESEELVINRSSRLKDNIVHAYPTERCP